MLYRERLSTKSTGQKEYEGQTADGVEIPPILMRAVDEHTDSLEIALRSIKYLPSEFQFSLNKYFHPAYSNTCLQNLVYGMKSLRSGTLPNKAELLIIACPHDMLHDLAFGLRSAAACESIPGDVRTNLSDISARLDEASKAMTWRGCYGVRGWAEDTVDRFYPEASDGLIPSSAV